ncbi:MAG: DUF167 family protein [Arhodomonas sp.]|nr:DUF167 family protein [Arhodomonas sp.]
MEPLGERLKVRVTAPPVDGKANRHLVRYLRRTLGCQIAWSSRPASPVATSGPDTRSSDGAAGRPATGAGSLTRHCAPGRAGPDRPRPSCVA